MSTGMAEPGPAGAGVAPGEPAGPGHNGSATPIAQSTPAGGHLQAQGAPAPPASPASQAQVAKAQVAKAQVAQAQVAQAQVAQAQVAQAPVTPAHAPTAQAPTPTAPSPIETAVAVAGALHRALSGVLLGTPGAVTAAVLAALSGGHLLIEDVPGVGKTVLARAIATSLGAGLARIQGHPDLLPSDVTGVNVYSADAGTWEFRPGPIFSHVVLLDELNRTPPRTQSALLEAMEEQQVSVDGETWALPRPHLVVATQNPIGQLGTYPLVESQLDRFALSTSIGYPDAAVEAGLVLHHGGRAALDTLGPVCTVETWQYVIDATATAHVAPVVAEYAVSLVRATRSLPGVRLGASPRAAIALIRTAQGHAVLAGRTYVTPDDVQVVTAPCLSHRLVCDGGAVEATALLRQLVATTPAPRP